MKKRIISVMMAALLLMGMCGGVSAAIGPADCIYYEDFESFQDTNFSSGTGYTIQTDHTKYLAVATGKKENEWPTKTFKLDTSGSLQFDIKCSGVISKVYASFDGGAYKELFSMLIDGRGPLVRLADGTTPYFFYNQSDDKPDHKEWNTIKLDFDFAKGELQASCNGEPVKFYDRSYAEQPAATFTGKALTGIKFGYDTTMKEGQNALFDNVMVYKSGAGQGGGSVTAEADTPYSHQLGIRKLNALGIIPDDIQSFKMADTLTRAQFTVMAMKAIGAKEGYAAENAFSDITDPSVAAYVNMAVNMGAISGTGDGLFEPDEMVTLNQAIKIMTCLLGYEPKALESGGYPTGYLIVADNKNMLKGIKVVVGGQLMNMKDTVSLLNNCLTIPMMVRSSYGDKQTYTDNDKSQNILWVYHKLKEIEREIVTTDLEKKRLTCRPYGSGEEAALYDVSSRVDLRGLEGTRQYLWVDEEEAVAFLYPYKEYKVVYGYVSEINNGKLQTTVKPDQVGALSFSNFTGTVRTGADFEIAVNGQPVVEAIDLQDRFCKVILAEGQLQKLDILTDEQSDFPAEGGIITSVSKDTIRFVSGENAAAVLEEINRYDKIVTVLNGVEATYSDLKNDMVFEYCRQGNQTLTLIAASQKYTGRLEQYSEYGIVVGGVELPITSKPVYLSLDNGEQYSLDESLDTAVSAEVKVYTDMSGAVRYVTMTVMNEFYGIVYGADRGTYNDDYRLGVFHVVSGKMQQDVYEVDLGKKTIYDPDVTFEEAAAHAKDVTGGGIYRFQVNGKKITRITKVEWLGGQEQAVSGEFDYRAPRVKINGTYRMVDQNQIFLLQDAKGEFEPRVINWSDLNNKLQSGVKVLIENTQPIGKLMVITAGAGTIYQDASNYGMVTKKTKISKDGELFFNYTFVKDAAESTKEIKEEYDFHYASKPLKLYDFIIYRPGSLYPETGGMNMTGCISLSDEAVWNSNKTVSGDLVFKKAGVYTGIKSNHLKTNLNGEIQYNLLNGSYGVYEVNGDHTKFRKAKLTDALNKEIYVLTIGDLVRNVFFIE